MEKRDNRKGQKHPDRGHGGSGCRFGVQGKISRLAKLVQADYDALIETLALGDQALPAHN